MAFDPETDLDITGLERWEVLKALHDNTRPVGMGRLHDKALSEDEAKAMIAFYDSQGVKRFDYLHGRPLKIGFVGTWITRVDLYDRDSLRPARLVIEELRKRDCKGA